MPRKSCTCTRSGGSSCLQAGIILSTPQTLYLHHGPAHGWQLMPARTGSNQVSVSQALRKQQSLQTWMQA